MSAITADEVLDRFFPGLTPAEVEAELSQTPAAGATPISSASLAYLREHGGPEAVAALDGWEETDPAEIQRQRALTAARTLEELLGSSLTLEEAAARLGVSRSRISHRIGDRSLYAITVQGRRYLPDWQFLAEAAGGGADLLPGLGQLVPAIPKTMHPLAVESFMTSVLDEIGASPVDFIWSSGDVEVIVDWMDALARA
ncbi:hypothetical protein [Nocardioides sp.]|uniref:hypothetical protein n=1 Tax=Nocardioides sp. TaxID=35761 RepID=UPI0026034497|nr:hypothetical protein [Nocardioides sp.]